LCSREELEGRREEFKNTFYPRLPTPPFSLRFYFSELKHDHITIDGKSLQVEILENFLRNYSRGIGVVFVLGIGVVFGHRTFLILSLSEV
jgi:hypothetical protein